MVPLAPWVKCSFCPEESIDKATVHGRVVQEVEVCEEHKPLVVAHNYEGLAQKAIEGVPLAHELEANDPDHNARITMEPNRNVEPKDMGLDPPGYRSGGSGDGRTTVRPAGIDWGSTEISWSGSEIERERDIDRGIGY